MPELDATRILRTLISHDVEFVLIGAGAAYFQGNPVYTLDLDLMPRQDIDNAERLADALDALGARAPGVTGALEERAFLGWRPPQLETDAGPVDVVPQAIALGSYDDVRPRAVELRLEGQPFLVASLDDLIRSKEALGRPKDVAALPLLHQTRLRLQQVAVLRYGAFLPRGGGPGGNPAGVVLDARGWDDERRLAVAAVVGFSETAFLEPTDRPRTWRARYWSPRAEVPFCGHASVAAAVALAERDGAGDLVLETAVGDVPVLVTSGDDGLAATLTSVPTRSAPARQEDVAEALAALGWRADELDPALPPHVAHAGADHLVLATGTRERLAALDYDYPRLATLMVRTGWTTLQLVHRESATRWHSRNPFPPGGVVEDPATGAAALALGGYLRALGEVTTVTRLEVRQGEDLGRPCLLLVDVDPADERVRVTGTAARLAD